MVKRFLAVIIISLVLLGGMATAQTYQSTMSKTGATNNGLYAALGDSVAAGAGLIAVPNATAQDTQCGRSSEAYPQIVARQRNLQILHIACSGAKASDLYTSQGISGVNPTAQLDQAFSHGVPQLITITAGANDAQWLNFMRACYATECATQTNQHLVNFYLEGLKTKYQTIFNTILSRSPGSTPTVVITGYYNPVSNYCKGRQSYATNAEINFLNKQRDALNKTIRDAAAPYHFVKYASTNFTDHGLCAKEPWSQSLNEPAPLHPNAKGQQKIAESVISVIQ